jgi:2-polyprenyl-3-methyl-5-hydroxy-6-metoxy-1,4-benzoquinol methylase
MKAGKVTTFAKSLNAVRSTAASGAQVYESARAVNEYLLFHYGKHADVFPFKLPVDFALNFTERSATFVHDALVRSSLSDCSECRVLDVGCAVGGLSFALAKHFRHVVGLDYSQHFVDAANEMKQSGHMQYTVQKQGEIYLPATAEVESSIDRSRVTFIQGDACNLPLDGSFGVF